MYKISEYKILNIKQVEKEVVDYGVKMLGVIYEWRETKGEGIKVGIIDTGIDTEHDDLKGRIRKTVNFTGGDAYDVTDEVGHGTHVAGCIAAEQNGIGVVGAAPECDLYIAKAFDKNGVAVYGAVEKSIRWMIDNGVNIINMSFSSEAPNNAERALISECYRNNIFLVAAAGNSGGTGNADTIGYPAKYKSVMAVTAVDMNKERSSFSSQGENAQISAAGTDILSTYKNNSYAVLSGTSMAAPLISGAAAILQGKALLRFNRLLSVDELSMIMDIYADDLGNRGKDNQYGYGLFSFGRFFV